MLYIHLKYTEHNREIDSVLFCFVPFKLKREMVKMFKLILTKHDFENQFTLYFEVFILLPN